MSSNLCLAVILLLLVAADTKAQSDSPRDGEGLYSLLNRNGITPTASAIAEFRALNEGELLPGNGLKKGRKYVLPGGSNTLHEPLFGPKYENVDRKSDLLAGVTYYLISGHGGADPGAVGRRNGQPLPEDEYAYDVTLRVARGLMANGAHVEMMVRDTDGIRDDKYLKPDTDERNPDGSAVSKRRRVQERVERINALSRRSKAKKERVVEIHVDARVRSETQVDVHFLYSSPGGKRLSNILRDTMEQRYERAQPNRGYNGKVSRRNLYTLVNTRPVATYIELGNVHHRRDQVRIIEPGNRQAIANWLVLGMIKEATGKTPRTW